MKILLPVDGSDFTQRMLSYIAEHDELLGPGHDYTAFTAVPPVPPNAARHVDRGTLDEYYRDQAEEVLAPVRAFAQKQGWTLKTAYAPGHAAEAIATFAKAEKPGLIVMGSHGHAALRSVMLGSVASGVLARCQTPVLLIR
jgi:nucleotide-binding universal stress UspA family protein